MTIFSVCLMFREALQSWKKQGRSCIWLKVPIYRSEYISAASKFGFQFHHAENQMSLLKLWLNADNEDRTPRFATHQVGVSGKESSFVINKFIDKNFTPPDFYIFHLHRSL